MDRSWIRLFFALTAVAVALAVPAVTTAQSPTPVKTPTAVGTGGAAATVDPLATAAAVEALRDGATPSMLRRRGRRARGHGAVFVRDRRRRLHGDPPADGAVTTIDSRRRRRKRCGPTRSGREECPCRSTRRASAGSLPACPEPCAPGTRR